MTADTAHDPHSPQVHGILWSHMGWFLTSNGFRTHWKRIPDLARFPELRWLDRYDVLVPVLLAAALFGFGALLAHFAPQTGVTGSQMLVWGFFRLDGRVVSRHGDDQSPWPIASARAASRPATTAATTSGWRY